MASTLITGKKIALQFPVTLFFNKNLSVFIVAYDNPPSLKHTLSGIVCTGHTPFKIVS